MSEKHWIDDKHYRVISEDRTKSWVYRVDGGLFFPDTLIEVADHHKDGTTDAFEPDYSAIGQIFFGGKGEKKNG